jgi:hypothetical protein
MEAAPTSETSVDNYFTRHYIPEDKSELHTRSRENLKSHKKNTSHDGLLARISSLTLNKIAKYVSE